MCDNCSLNNLDASGQATYKIDSIMSAWTKLNEYSCHSFTNLTHILIKQLLKCYDLSHPALKYIPLIPLEIIVPGILPLQLCIENHISDPDTLVLWLILTKSSAITVTWKSLSNMNLGKELRSMAWLSVKIWH